MKKAKPFAYVLEIESASEAMHSVIARMKLLGYKTVGGSFKRGADPRLLQAFVKYIN